MKYTWKTAAVIRETMDCVTIIFETGVDRFHFLPGQFVNVSLAIDGQLVSRSYSLSSSPDEDEKPAITVKKVAGGLMSTYIVNHAEVISEWTVEGPQGIFHLPADTRTISQLVLIAGGSGITPIFSMLKYALKHTALQVTLLYTSKRWQDKIFRSALLQLAQWYPERLQLQLVLTQESETKDTCIKSCMQRRLTKLTLKKLLKQAAFDNKALYFICGPGALITLAEETLATLLVDSNRICKEYFSTEGLQQKEVVLPDTIQEVLLHFYEQSNLLEVAPGITILEAALTDRIELPYSCRNGTCGKCTGKLLAGQVHMLQNYVLNEDQLKEGYILLCQSHPLTNNVTVEAF